MSRDERVFEVGKQDGKWWVVDLAFDGWVGPYKTKDGALDFARRAAKHHGGRVCCCDRSST